MFPEVYKKFYTVLGVSIMLGLGAMSLSDEGASGMVIAEQVSTTISWIGFFFGLFVGAVAVGLVLLIIHYERQRL